MSDQPQRKRVVLCRGQFCNMGRRADALYHQLQPRIADLNGGAYPPRVKLETASCLSMCGAGPNLIVYPAGAIYNHVDHAALEAVIAAHLRE